MLDEILDGGQVHDRGRDRLQQAQISSLVGRDVARPHALGITEEISLKQRVSVFCRRNELNPRLDLVSEQQSLIAMVLGGDGRALFFRQSSDINLDDVRKGDKRFSRIVHPEIIESDSIAPLFEPLTSTNHAFIDGNIFLDFDNYFVRWKKEEMIL